MRKVLVVDDNAVNRKLAAALLRRRGMHVEEADSGQAALEMLRVGQFDSVLLDISMPVMDGKEVCQILRSTPELAVLRVIAYTAHAMESERQSIMAAGFDDLLVKPISGQDLLRVLPD
jgi:two-component system, chemotaxis family, chemotaxis protein CheY